MTQTMATRPGAEEEQSTEAALPEPRTPSAQFLADLMIDPDRLMLEGVDTSKKPLFSISEMATFFFARSSHWVRWLEGENRLVLDGVPLVPIRTTSNARKYDLALVEKIAHALASNETITGEQLRHALLLVRIQAEMNHYIKEPEADAAEDA